MKIPRRKFIVESAGLILTSAQLLSGAARSGGSILAEADGRKILVIVQWAGGNDGLNMLVPYGSGAYYQARPTLAVKQEDVLPLTDTLGLNPNMAALTYLFNAGKLAIALGVGYPDPSHSHFRSIEIWQTAAPEKISKTGWLGRYLDCLYEGKSNSSGRFFPAINVDPILPKSLNSERVIVPSVSDIGQGRMNTDAHYQLNRYEQSVAYPSLHKSLDLSLSAASFLKEIGLSEATASDYLAKAMKNYQSTVSYPNHGFGRGMKFIAQMIVTGVDAQAYNISLGGFDTHANQFETQSTLLKQFADSIAAFQKDLEEHGLDQDVLLIAFSEFGRKLAENADRGTDHGTAAPVLIMGSSINGGLYGDHPSLTDLDQGDLSYTVDFRSIYATILDRWFKADSRQILGRQFENLGFV